MIYHPKYQWPKIKYNEQNETSPIVIYSKARLNINLDNAQLGGSFFDSKANWFKIRQDLCEKNIFLYDIQTEKINVFNGILIKPIVNNLNIYTDAYDYNMIYLTCKTKLTNLKKTEVVAIIKFEKDHIKIIEILTDSEPMQTD